MAFRKTVAAEALKLAEGLLSEFPLVATLDHAVDELVLELGHPAGEFERRHRTSELVGLAGREAGALDGDAHRLFLEQRHAERFAENLLQRRFRKHDRLLSLAAAQIRMDHVSLDRTRPDDGDLDDEIVERPRLHPRQHRHLRAALDLECAERVGLPDHGVGPRVFRRDGS
jgi:hypothetical protein